MTRIIQKDRLPSKGSPHPSSLAARLGLLLIILVGLFSLLGPLVLAAEGYTKKLAAEGDLDPSFGNGGVVTTTIGMSGIDGDRATGVGIQSDGKIVVVGRTTSLGGDEQFTVVRYSITGTLDTSFGNGGVVTTTPSQFGVPGGGGFNALNVVFEPDGRIVVVGGYGGILLARYSATGTLDATFGTGGVVTNPIGYGVDLVRQTDGKYLVSAFGSSDFIIARYTTSGTLDSEFGTGGLVTTSLGFASTSLLLTLQEDNKIVVAGRAGGGEGTGFAVARYNISGTLDTTYGTGGAISTTIDNNPGGGALGVDIDNSGRAVVGGSTTNSDGARYIALVRYTISGTLDSTFGTNGIVTTTLGITVGGLDGDVIIDPNGKILYLGAIGPYSGGLTSIDGRAFLVARYNSDGSLDTTFGNGGIVTTTLGSKADSLFGTLQSDGKIVQAGMVDDRFAVVRYLSDAAISSEILFIPVIIKNSTN